MNSFTPPCFGQYKTQTMQTADGVDSARKCKTVQTELLLFIYFAKYHQFQVRKGSGLYSQEFLNFFFP